MDDSDLSPDPLSHSQMSLPFAILVLESLESLGESWRVSLSFLLLFSCVYESSCTCSHSHTTLLLFHHHHLFSIIIHERHITIHTPGYMEKRKRNVYHPRVSFALSLPRKKSFIRDRRHHHHQMNDEQQDEQVNSTHKPDRERETWIRKGELYSPNGHHSKWNIPRGSLVGTPDVVDFVCLRQDDVVVLENNGVGVDSALRVNSKRGEERARKRQKQTWNVISTCYSWPVSWGVMTTREESMKKTQRKIQQSTTEKSLTTDCVLQSCPPRDMSNWNCWLFLMCALHVSDRPRA